LKQRLVKITKRFVLSALVTVLVAFVAVLAFHREGSIRTDIWINSPPQDVWRVLTATADYPKWNPMITRLGGHLRAGSVIEFTNGSGPDAMAFRPTILAVHSNQELRWKGHVWVPGVFDGEHSFILEGKGGRTHFVQSEKFTGLFSGKITQGILEETAGHMRAMDQALKVRAEALTGRAPE